MKKIISISLTFFILVQSFYFCFYSTPVYGGLLDVNPDLLEDMANNPEKYEPATMKLTEFLVRTITGGQALDKFFGTSSQELISNIKALFLKEGNCKTDGNNYYLTQNFANEFNQAVQDKVHALNGYYIVDSIGSTSLSSVTNLLKTYGYDITKLSDTAVNRLKDLHSATSVLVIKTSPGVIHFEYSTLDCYDLYAIGDNKYSCFDSIKHITDNTASCYLGRPYNTLNSNGSFLGYSQPITILGTLGAPLKLFYSLADLNIYYDNGKQRTYAPQLPSTTISIPIKYINNSVSLPDITYNINTTNKTEVEIQNEYNTTLNNYLDDLNKFSDGGSGNNPTPTPSGGGSGDFGDGTTPTPKPDFGDGSDLTDTNDWLKKIYEWLQSFGDTHSKFEQTITDYIEANDGKLDQIIEAINALSGGKTEDEKNGCKYDFTALSDFMTKLWNESDKKFDKMVELLEENNKYQKKLVNSLNEIKAILVTQTIMDVFQDRSHQTAEKAKDKFPTSLPWDIALVVNAMSAEPEKPQFNLPIQIKSLNINEEIHVDLASGEWEKLAKTCRYLLSILFILLLVQLSRKLFSNGGDD